MLETFRQKKLKALYRIGCLSIGVVVTFLTFYLCIIIDNLINTFEMPIMHLVYVPLILSYLSMFLECKFMSENVKPDFLFLVGNIIGLLFVFKNAINIENFNNFNETDYLLYNLLRYFTPVIVFIVGSVCIYLIRNIILQYRIARAENYWKIQELINKTNEEFIENPILEKEEEPKDLLEKAHSHISKLSDIIGKNIDPNYERDDKNK